MKPNSLAWVGDRLPGDPRYVRLLCDGAVAMPAPTTARACWEAQLAERYNDNRIRARMMLPILDQFNEETGGRFLTLTIAELRDAMANLAEDGQ